MPQGSTAPVVAVAVGIYLVVNLPLLLLLCRRTGDRSFLIGHSPNQFLYLLIAFPVVLVANGFAWARVLPQADPVYLSFGIPIVLVLAVVALIPEMMITMPDLHAYMDRAGIADAMRDWLTAFRHRRKETLRSMAQNAMRPFSIEPVELPKDDSSDVCRDIKCRVREFISRIPDDQLLDLADRNDLSPLARTWVFWRLRSKSMGGEHQGGGTLWSRSIDRRMHRLELLEFAAVMVSVGLAFLGLIISVVVGDPVAVSWSLFGVAAYALWVPLRVHHTRELEHFLAGKPPQIPGPFIVVLVAIAFVLAAVSAVSGADPLAVLPKFVALAGMLLAFEPLDNLLSRWVGIESHPINWLLYGVVVVLLLVAAYCFCDASANHVAVTVASTASSDGLIVAGDSSGRA